jgi:hypothetical protein
MIAYKRNGKPQYRCRAGIVGRNEANVRYVLRNLGVMPEVERYPVKTAIKKAGL